jgi:phosphopantothenoylcysteine decarboxylase / phosphopantothenate---cysteine ligase
MARGNVLLLVTGGIAAYKACQLTRLLRQTGLGVKVAMTASAQRFVTPMTFAVLSENPVATDLWGEGQSQALDHIEYARWADLAVIAPATANTLAKLAQGIADDIVSTLLLAHPGPVLVAPAMNDNMWRHPATQANLALLRARGVAMIEPDSGFLACGTVSIGRMAGPERIAARIHELLADLAATPGPADGFWSGRRVVVTAGPTHEAVDPVRVLTNHSSGVFGYALARRAAAAGAEVTLIAGPTALPDPPGVGAVRHVISAADLAAAVAAALDAGADWLFMAAAVADFTPREPEAAKIKKEAVSDVWRLELVRTTDILGEVVAPRRGGSLKVVAFALETDRLRERAEAKRRTKSADYVVANGAGFGDVPHQVVLLGPEGELWANIDPLSKDDLAAELLARLATAESAREARA